MHTVNETQYGDFRIDMVEGVGVGGGGGDGGGITHIIHQTL